MSTYWSVLLTGTFSHNYNINNRIMKILMSFALTAVHTVCCTSINARGVTVFSYSPLQISYRFALSVSSMTCISPSSLHFFSHTFLPKTKGDLCKTERHLCIYKKNRATNLKGVIKKSCKITFLKRTKSCTKFLQNHKLQTKIFTEFSVRAICLIYIFFSLP